MTEKGTESFLSVLILATTFPRWQDDTVPRFVQDLSRELAQRNIDVTVLAPHHPGAKRHEILDGVEIRRVPYFYPKRYQCLCYDGGILETIKRRRLALLQVPLLILSMFVYATWLTVQRDFDVINSHWLVPNAVIGAVMNLIFDVPHIVTLHAGGVLGLKRLPGSRFLARFVYRRSSATLPVSSAIRNEYVELVGDRFIDEDHFQIQPMGVDTQDYSQFDKSEAKSAIGYNGTVLGLFVGRLAEKKGLGSLVDAVESLEELSVDLKIVVVGTGPLEDQLRQRVRMSDTSDRIRLTGWISERELIEYYCAADFVVVPSIEATSGDTEGMPTVIAEAFAAGNPVIASDVGGIADVVGDQNGILVKQKRSDELANALRRLAHSEQMRDELEEGARETAERLNWQRCGQTYIDVFSTVLIQSNNCNGRTEENSSSSG